MKKLLPILLFLISATAWAQSSSRGLWCPPGATWRHQYRTTVLPSTLVTIPTRYTRDSTTANGEVCQVLNSQGIIQLTRADADRVWQYKQGQFYKVHDFSARPGESWPYAFSYGMCTETVTVTVDSVGQRQLGGQLRRWFAAHYTVGGQTVLWGRVYEGIGTLNAEIFPQASRVGTCSTPPELPTLLGLSCFGTSAQPSLVGSGCQAVPTATQNPEPVGFAVYPTISSGELTLQLPAAYTQATLRLYNLTGQVVWQRAGRTGAPEALSLGVLPQGLYRFSVEQLGQPTLSRRLVLQ